MKLLLISIISITLSSCFNKGHHPTYDLTVDSINCPTVFYGESRNTYTVTITNNGNSPIELFNIHLEISPFVKIGTGSAGIGGVGSNNNSIGAKESKEFNIEFPANSYDIFSDPISNITYTVTVDPEDFIKEFDETNNSANITVQVFNSVGG